MLTVRRPLAVALALVAGVAPAAAQNLVQNGGFESPFITGNVTLSGCPAAFVWCVGQGNVDLIQSFWQPGEGRQSIDLNGTAAGSLFQDLVTTPGELYDISFLVSGHPEGDPTKTMELFWGETDLGSFTWTVGPDQSLSDMLWSRLIIRDILATSTTTRLEFRSTTTSLCGSVPEPACGFALDEVGVVEVSGVPEPATLLLVGGGLLALGGVACRRRPAA
jgi:hypothetical protein